MRLLIILIIFFQTTYCLGQKNDFAGYDNSFNCFVNVSDNKKLEYFETCLDSFLINGIHSRYFYQEWSIRLTKAEVSYKKQASNKLLPTRKYRYDITWLSSKYRSFGVFSFSKIYLSTANHNIYDNYIKYTEQTQIRFPYGSYNKIFPKEYFKISYEIMKRSILKRIDNNYKIINDNNFLVNRIIKKEDLNIFPQATYSLFVKILFNNFFEKTIKAYKNEQLKDIIPLSELRYYNNNTSIADDWISLSIFDSITFNLENDKSIISKYNCIYEDYLEMDIPLPTVNFHYKAISLNFKILNEDNSYSYESIYLNYNDVESLFIKENINFNLYESLFTKNLFQVMNIENSNW